MLNNSRLSEFSKSALKFMPYETKIKMYDDNCMKCPFSCISIKRGLEITEVNNIEIATDICIDDIRTSIVRGCKADSGYSLDEITSNTCSFWYPPYNDTNEPDEDDYYLSKEDIEWIVDDN